MGYNKEEIISDLENIPNSDRKKVISDMALSAADTAAKWLELRLIFSRIRRAMKRDVHYPIFSSDDKQNNNLIDEC